jgi:4-alpha-glucanotransferase
VSSADLQALAETMGILSEWHDIAGKRHVTAPDTQRALLAAMGLAVGSEAEAAEALAAHRAAAAARRLPEEVVATAGELLRLPLAAGTGGTDWHLACDDGTTQDGRAGPEILLTPPPGLHRLSLGDEHCRVIAAPAQAPGVDAVLGRPRAWGFTAALYGLRSERNLGIGDYADLAAAAAELARLGADFLGINPLHARGAASDIISPYTPSCRTALEPRHIAIDAVPGFAASSRVKALLRREAERLAALRADALVDYPAAGAIEERALRLLFADFERLAGGEAEAFAAWRAGDGRALEWFALFEAISLQHGADWRHWPEALRHPDTPAARDFAAGNAPEVRYHAWLQWLAVSQLAAAQQHAREAGMGLGLYLDVAVGVRPGGADSWAAPDCFAEGVSLGAPPDAFNPAGQNWALAPFSPPGLRRNAYRPFIAMLRTAMRHAGVIRIDHILGLRRSFWVPDGAPGCYVAYPQEALLALIRIEAWRAGCVVVGEDLGSVPPGLRERLSEAGLLGCAVMQFEKKGGRFRRPRDYRPAALASFGTHDTPTLRGWWSGWDIDRRHDLGGQDATARAAEHAERVADRRALARLLQDEGLAPEGLDAAAPPPEADDALVAALHGLLARAASTLVAVQVDDALGQVEQQNMPGTTNEHPNWRRRYPVAVGDLAEHAGLQAIAEIFRSRRESTTVPRRLTPCQ